jgi:hypothetical protein
MLEGDPWGLAGMDGRGRSSMAGHRRRIEEGLYWARWNEDNDSARIEREGLPLARSYLVDAQHDYIDGLAARVVIPLRSARVFGARAERLHRLVQVDGEDTVLNTAAMGAVPRSELRTAIGSLKAFRRTPSRHWMRCSVRTELSA